LSCRCISALKFSPCTSVGDYELSLGSGSSDSASWLRRSHILSGGG